MRGFDLSEFEARVHRAQSLMADNGLAALLLTTEPEVRYFSGFLTRFWESPTRPWFMVVPASGYPVAVIPSIGRSLMAETWITDIRTWSAPDLADDGIGLLADTLREFVFNDGDVGVPDGLETHVRMPIADFERLRGLLGDIRVRGDAGIVQKLRMVKSPAEVQKVEMACAIANRAFARVPQIASEGTPLDEVFRRFQMLCLEEGADWVPYLAGGAQQGGYSDVISPPHAHPLAEGDILMLDTGLVWDGYFCDFDRNWSVGPANAETRNAHAKLVQASDAAVDIAYSGSTASDLHSAMISVLGGSETGTGRLGHGLGMSLTEWPSIIPDDDTVLEPGMILTLEPSLAVGNKILVHEENIVITDASPRFISSRIGSELQQI